MVSGLKLVVFITCLGIIHALPDHEQTPNFCAAPGYQARCMLSNSRREISVCGVYQEEECSFFCRYLVSQLFRPQLPCLNRKLRSEMTTILQATCQRNCHSARKQILNDENRSNKSTIGALIFLVVRDNDVIEGRSYGFKKTGQSLLPSSQRKAIMDRCNCYACQKHGARCGECCKFRGIQMP